jgi:hypothetical protein
MIVHSLYPVTEPRASLTPGPPLAQLAAVIAHEHAHQSRRHHALLLAAQILRIGFPWLPAARAANSAIAHLVELAADDAAIHRHRPADVAAALAKLATAPAIPWDSAPAARPPLSVCAGTPSCPLT